MAIHDQKDRAPALVQQSAQELDELLAVELALYGHKRIKPWAEMAEIRLRLKRPPVAFTTGVWPTGAQVVPQ